VQKACTARPVSPEEKEVVQLLPSLFGRNLVEQVRADGQMQNKERSIPVIVEKCINAVQILGMDYEGLYRKSGGSGQIKLLTQLFERGDYDAIDLLDSELVNDVSSITSVLKSYFRQLPNPLMTFALHEAFVDAATSSRHATMGSIVGQLPREHYETLRVLMLHLHQVQELRPTNRMDAKNLGVVFGPTLMRSSDPAREFGDMAGKAQTVEWLIANAPSIFKDMSFVVGI